MSQNPDIQTQTAHSPTLTTCFNCHSAMPSELRFCRNCGFRLGEGVAEYTPTVRFDGTTVPANAASATSFAPRRRRRMSGMAWVFVALLVFFVGAAAFTAVLTPRRVAVRGGGFTPVINHPKSFVGVDGFEDADDNAGATFNSVSAPDTPADKAGLIGGDIITKFDGHDIHDGDAFTELMEATPVGKTVEVEYLRDGEKKTTKLTTIANDENRRLRSVFDKRPEGIGRFGYEQDDAEVVDVPGTKLKGVRLDSVDSSMPADMAGIKKGDIVVEFDKIPIRTKGELLMRVRRAIPYSTVNVVIMRGEEGKPFEKIEIPVKMGKQ